MTAQWPTSLPPLQFGVEYRQRDAALRTDMANGRTYVRRNFTAVPADFEARWMMTDAEAAAFEDFHQHTLLDGSLWFYLPIKTPTGYAPKLVQFSGPYRARQVSHLLWEYKADMITYLRVGASPAPQPDPGIGVIQGGQWYDDGAWIDSGLWEDAP